MESKSCYDRDAGIADLSLLRHFVAVVNSSSFTRASEHLNLSQSVVSRSVSRLENILGVTLLVRTTRKLRLTPAGEALFSEAVASLDRISVAVDDARRIGRGGYASLRIGLCPSLAAHVSTIQRGLRTFRLRWPNIAIKICSTRGALQPAALRASDLDAGIMQLNRPSSEGLTWQVLTRSPLMVAVPSEWKVRSKQLRLKNLGAYPWILPDPRLSRASYESMLATLRSGGFEPKVVGLADDNLTARVMLGCGFGAALVHATPAQRKFEGYELVPLKLPGDSSFAETVISWASTSTSNQIKALANCLLESSAESS
jgi:DNA-binding transcriptional LysR family regulator